MIEPTPTEIAALQQLPGFAGREAYRPSPMRDKAIEAMRARSVETTATGTAIADDPNNLEGPGPTTKERAANSRALDKLHPGNRFRLMFGQPMLAEPIHVKAGIRLAQYFAESPSIDFAGRAEANGDGTFHFYLHPAGVSGETVDLVAGQDGVILLEDKQPEPGAGGAGDDLERSCPVCGGDRVIKAGSTNHDCKCKPAPAPSLPEIVTRHCPPAIPVRSFDWTAVRDGYEPLDPIGYGATEAESIADLLEKESSAQPAPAAGDTPRTENYLENLSQAQLRGRDALECIEGFARTLERENAALRGALEASLVADKAWEAADNYGHYNENFVQEFQDELLLARDEAMEKFRQMRDAALTGSAGAGWLPIESLNYDVKGEVLLYSPTYGQMFGKTDWEQGGRPDHIRVGNARYEYSDFSHWRRPLPPPPAEPAGKEGA